MLFSLLLAPITAPLGGLRFVLNQVKDLADRELLDKDRIHEELVLLQLRLEEKEITEEEYAAQEADLMARLRAVREREKGNE